MILIPMVRIMVYIMIISLIMYELLFITYFNYFYTDSLTCNLQLMKLIMSYFDYDIRE